MPDPIDPQEPLRLHVLHSERGRLSSEAPPSTRAQIDEIVDAAEAAPNGLVVYLHGGLVSLRSALDDAQRRVEDFGEGADAHAVVFAWESGPLETPWNDLTPELNEVLQRTADAVAAADGARQSQRGRTALAADVRLADDDDDDDDEDDETADRVLVAALESDVALMRSVAALTGEVPPPLIAREQLLSTVRLARPLDEPAALAAEVPEQLMPTYQALFGDGGGSPPEDRLRLRPELPSAWQNLIAFASGVGRQVRARRDAGRMHGTSQTILEEVIRRARLGGVAWESMKRHAEALGADGPDFAGTALVDALADALSDSRASNGPRGGVSKLTLVAHSAGSIAACSIIDRIRLSNVGIEVDVVFLAPAVTAERFARTIEAEGIRRVISRFRMFTMRDDKEREDITSPAPSVFSYGHSLLYLVSGAFEVASPGSGSPVVGDVPITGMRRFAEIRDRLGEGERGWVDTVERFIRDHDAHVLSPSPDGPAGRASTSTTHGDFDEDLATVASVQHFIRSAG
jgi:hypothetical protein